MMHDDEGDGGESDAVQAIMDMLDSKGGELMKEKYGPKDEPKEPVAHGHVVTVEIKPHAPGREGGKGGDDALTEDMLKSLLDGDEDDGEKE